MLSINDWLALYPNPNTRKSYKRALRRYIEHIYAIPNGRRTTDYNGLSIRYLEGTRDLREDLRGFAVFLNRFAPKTATLYFTGVLLWLEENDLTLPPRELKRIAARLPKGGAQTRDQAIDHQFLRQVLPHLPLMGQALVLLLASSGMRIGEALKLSLDDIDLDCSPARIDIPGPITKNKSPRISFITEEAATVLREWLKVRPKYMVSAARRNSGLVAAGTSGIRPDPGADRRLFPATSRTTSEIWQNALTAAGYAQRDPITNHLTRTYHGLRRFFLSQSKLVIPAEISEHLAGHRGYLSDSYRRYTDTELIEYYKQAEPQLTVQAPAEVREIQSEFRQKMQAHSDILESLVSENIDLKKRLEAIEAQQARMDQISALVARHDAGAEDVPS